MDSRNIWKPIEFDTEWNNVSTEKFDNILPSWKRRREELKKYPEQFNSFLNQIKRKQAIDTGIIERMYDLKRGITETFIKEGFVDLYLHHGDADISAGLLMEYLKDNFEAVDFIFDFVKNDRQLSVSYIKELHSLITRHQDYTEAVDSLGNHIKTPLLKGEFKKSPNNPGRDNVIYNYCPPEQVDSEMDNLIRIYNNELSNSHVLVRAAFLHHAFTQIHPFQDGNGRIARLLASFVLIKDGLFPLSIDRDERVNYIEASELADKNKYQPLTDIFADNQISSIELSLNWKTVENKTGYDSVVNILGRKLFDYRNTQLKIKVSDKIMLNAFNLIKSQIINYKDDLKEKLDDYTRIETHFSLPSDKGSDSFHDLIKNYANLNNYYVDLTLPKCLGILRINISKSKQYRLIISLHHYGYDDSAFAIGAFFSKVIDSTTDIGLKNYEYIDIPLGIPPLVISTEKDVSMVSSSVRQQIDSFVTAALACIANEL